MQTDQLTPPFFWLGREADADPFITWGDLVEVDWLDYFGRGRSLSQCVIAAEPICQETEVLNELGFEVVLDKPREAFRGRH